MTNALDKRRTGELSATRRRVESALARLPQPKNNQPMQAPAPEIVTLSCVCAVEDKPYTLRFTRQAGGSFRLLGSVMGHPAKTARAGEALAGRTVAVTVPIEELGDMPLPCAWCGDNGINLCKGKCDALVCGGRTVGNIFHCRKSCGASWVGVALESVEGETEEKRRAPSMQPAPPAARVPVAERLRLTAGSSVTKLRGGK
jgi:hypothetical protein